MKPKWKAAEINKLRTLYPSVTTKRVAKALKRSIRSVEGQVTRLGLKKEYKNPSRYKKGQSGRMPLPVGTERLDRCGYILVKLSNGVWKHKHRVMWEEYYGAPPEGTVSFKNGDRTDCSKENLRLTSPREQLRLNTVNALPEDIRQLIYMKGTLIRMINNRRKKHEQHAETEGQPILGDGGASSGQDQCGDCERHRGNRSSSD